LNLISHDASADWKTLPSIVFTPESYVERLSFAEMFPVERPVEVEIGSGDGSFLAEYARLHPETNFLGVERLLGRLRKLDKKARRLGLDNLRIIRIEAAYFTEYLLPPGSARALHIYFPDPWPKAKHAKNRLIQTAYLASVRKALAENGALYLRTDDAPYFEQMREVLAEAPGLEPIDTPSELAVVTTDFERHFNAQGTLTNYAAYRMI
jgi:tRNA (guanine-N7-)-methyltransferase